MTHFTSINCIALLLALVYPVWPHLAFIAPEFINKTLQVSTACGVVQGKAGVTRTGKNLTYYKYLGIPYAAPPVGALRWQSPEPCIQWDGVLNATIERDICVQMSTDDGFGIEDCLYVNIYVPQQSPNQDLLPVMVWIYGGRFVNGVSNFTVYGPDYLLELGVTFISFNYRLGIFGFLSTEDIFLPGNYGLKDQIALLRWVKQNIANFGGDPTKVTIFGDSAGAACVSYLMIIPQASGLFHNAIAESGSALCPWAFQRQPRRIVILLARACGIYETNSSGLVERLRKEHMNKLRSKLLTIKIGAIEPLNGLPFAPCLEPPHKDAVLTNHSNELFATGAYNRIPLMIGFTSQEAAYAQDVIEFIRPYIAHWDLMPQLIVPQNLNITTKVKRKELAMKIKTFYFGKKYISMSSKTEMMNFFGDTQFVRSIRHNVRICANYSPIYFYVFSYEGFIGRYGTQKEISRKVKGPGHVEDVYYIFLKTNLTTKNLTDLKVTATMTQMWTNFAKFSNPTPEESNFTVQWTQIDPKMKTINYLNIDSNISIKQNPRKDAMEFWSDIYKKYGINQYDSY